MLRTNKNPLVLAIAIAIPAMAATRHRRRAAAIHPNLAGLLSLVVGVCIDGSDRRLVLAGCTSTQWPGAELGRSIRRHNFADYFPWRISNDLQPRRGRQLMTAILLLKLFLVPTLIYAVTIAGRKWGPGVAGWLSAFPVVAGPILLTLTLEHGATFGADAASATLLAVIAILVFSLTYAWVSKRWGVAGSMAIALFTYALAVIGLKQLTLPIEISYVTVIIILLFVPKFFPTLDASVPMPKSAARDLPWRMLAGALLVLIVTFSAAKLGPRWSGFLAMFPVMSTVLVGFSHYFSGRYFAVTLLRGMVYGYYAFASFCLILSLLLRQQSVAVAFLVALTAAVIIQLLARYFLSTSQKK
jgi:hypothetical protein